MISSEHELSATDLETLSWKALANTRFESYWLASIPAMTVEPALLHDIECDLLIVGGGFCGLWAAILAKEEHPERAVVLIEARTIGNGASARPGAIVSTSVMHGIDNTERMFPGEVDALEQFGRDNLDAFRTTLDKYGVDCDQQWSGEMKVAIGDEAISSVDEDFRLYEKYGHDAQRLDRAELQNYIKSPLFSAGVWSRQRSGTLHPAKLLVGLKRIASELGVQLYENTPHNANRLEGNNVVVKTPRAEIRSAKVLLATNAWAAGHWKIKRRVAAIRDRIVVTEPLTASQMESIGWQQRQGIYDTRTQLNYMRLTKDNRILFGGRLGYFFSNNTDPQADKNPEPYIRLVGALFKTFPQLAGSINLSHAWSGPIGLTARMAVHFQRFHGGRMIFAGGYSGFGVTATRFGAKTGLALLDGKDTPESRLTYANTIPAYIPPEPFRWAGAKITMYALDTLDEKGGWRKYWVRLVEKMGFPITL